MLFSQMSGINITEHDLKVESINFITSSSSTATITPTSNQYLMIYGVKAESTYCLIRLGGSGGRKIKSDFLNFGGALTYTAGTKQNPILAGKGEPVYISKSAGCYITYVVLSHTTK